MWNNVESSTYGFWCSTSEMWYQWLWYIRNVSQGKLLPRSRLTVARGSRGVVLRSQEALATGIYIARGLQRSSFTVARGSCAINVNESCGVWWNSLFPPPKQIVNRASHHLRKSFRHAYHLLPPHLKPKLSALYFWSDTENDDRMSQNRPDLIRRVKIQTFKCFNF